MIGAIIGDIVGSIYEYDNIKTKNFPLLTANNYYTDDTILMLATKMAIQAKKPYWKLYRELCNKYPDVGYGGYFKLWLQSTNPYAYGSWGNGAAVRSIPIGYEFDSLATVLREAKSSAIWTHNHIEGIKGAQAVTTSILLARQGKNKEYIANYITRKFGYNLKMNYNELVTNYVMDLSCHGSVPQAIYCFLISSDFEDAIRTAISIGGDSDTIAAITGGIAEAYYGETLNIDLYNYLDDYLLNLI